MSQTCTSVGSHSGFDFSQPAGIPGPKSTPAKVERRHRFMACQRLAYWNTEWIDSGVGGGHTLTPAAQMLADLEAFVRVHK